MSPSDLPKAATGAAAGAIAPPAPSLCRMVLVHERRTLDRRTFAAVVTAVLVPGPEGVIAVTAFPPAQQAYPIASVPHENKAGEHDAYAWSWPPKSEAPRGDFGRSFVDRVQVLNDRCADLERQVAELVRAIKGSG